MQDRRDIAHKPSQKSVKIRTSHGKSQKSHANRKKQGRSPPLSGHFKTIFSKNTTTYQSFKEYFAQMNFTEFSDFLNTVMAHNGFSPLDDEAKSRTFYFLMQHMLEVGKTMNLTAIKEEKAIIVRHFLDSLTVEPFLPKNAKILDVGCGAGFPSLPLAIARPDLRITSLDSTEKRIKYVKETAELLGLTNVTAVTARAEEFASLPQNREKFDYATARAVASLPILCELTIPFVKNGGKLVAMKAKGAREEFEMSRSAIRQLASANSLENTTLHEVALVGCVNGEEINENRTIIVVNKLSSTPKRFPRKYAQIKKTPL